jgi:uncharacterized protein (DUF2384 family)
MVTLPYTTTRKGNINGFPQSSEEYRKLCNLTIPPSDKYVKIVKEVKMDFKAVPANIERYMRLLDFSKERLAAALGMSERSLYRRFKNPGTFTLEEMAIISKKFGVSFDKLFETA